MSTVRRVPNDADAVEKMLHPAWPYFRAHQEPHRHDDGEGDGEADDNADANGNGDGTGAAGAMAAAMDEPKNPRKYFGSHRSAEIFRHL